MQKASQLLADLERKQSAEGKEPFRMMLGDQNDKGVGLFSSCVLGDGWSSDGLLLLTRAELQRAKKTSGSQDTSGSRQKPPIKDECDAGGASGGLTNLKHQSEYTAMEAFSGIPSSS